MSELKSEKDPDGQNDLSLVDSWAVTISKSGARNVLPDITEFALDAVTNDGLLKDFPIVSTVVSIYKIGRTLKERSYIKKLMAFLIEIDKGNVDEEKRNEYIGRITKNKRTIQQELEYVLTLLDRYITEQKAKYCAKIFLAYIYEKIDWNLFCQFSEVLDRLLPGDMECLCESNLKNADRSKMGNCALQRLYGLGIVQPNEKPRGYDIKGNAIVTQKDGTYDLTFFGKTLVMIVQNEQKTL